MAMAQCCSSIVAVASSGNTNNADVSGVTLVRTTPAFISKSGRVTSRGRLTPITAAHAGLGATLPEGYEVAEHVVVDESHQETSGNIINKMMAGFKKFKEGKFTQNPEIYEPLKQGQAPEVMIIACADSRVCPTMLHDLNAGEAFIVRSVANLVPAFDPSMENVHHGTSAAVLYAVTVLGVKKVVVMGHSSCGGIKALMTMDKFDDNFVGSWVKIGLPAKETTLAQMGDKPLEEQCSFCEQEAVNVSLKNLLTFDFVEERVQKGELELYGMHYDFHDGKLTSWKAAPAKATVAA